MALRTTSAVALLIVAGLYLPSGDGGPWDREARPGAQGPTVTDGAREVEYDWLIQGGTVVDGSGAPSREVDLLLKDGFIAHVGSVNPDTLQVGRRFDAEGHMVAPGFIDLHAHGDPVEAPAFHNFLAMGVTTIVLGQDGSSPEASSLAAHLERVQGARPAVNVAYLMGHNTVRTESGVGFQNPGPDGLRRMTSLVERGLEAGAFGLSLGLEYSPGNQAGMEELVALAEPVAERNGVVMSHVRSEDADRVDSSVDELLEQGRRSGARVHISHLKIVLGSDTAQARGILQRMANERSQGRSVTADVYPYTASFTGLSILFPDWARPPNDYEAVVASRRAELARYLRGRVEGRNGPEATLFGSGPWAGRTLAEAAQEMDRPFEEVLVELGPGGARAAYFVMDPEVMTTFLLDPWVAVASDGSPTMAHPRGYGTFPRFLREQVVEASRLSVEEGIRKATSLPASILGVDDPRRVEVTRGLIAEGWAADLVAFRLEEVQDRADFQDPHQLARGMEEIWVNGELTWSGGAPLDRTGAGRAIRAGGGG